MCQAVTGRTKPGPKAHILQHDLLKDLHCAPLKLIPLRASQGHSPCTTLGNYNRKALCWGTGLKF